MATNTPVKVLELGLAVGDEAFPVNYITLGETNVSVQATKAENAFGETEGVDAPAVKNIVSSDVTVAYYDTTTKKLVPRKEGKVTLEVEFAGIKEKVTYELEVKAAQAPAVVESGETTKVQTGVENSLEISLVDQYGAALRSNQALTYTLKDAEGNAVGEAQALSIAAGEKGTVTFTLSKSGNYTIEVNKGDKVIGTLNLQGVEVDATKIDKFALTSAKSELDLKGTTEEAPATLTLTVNGFVDGVKVSQDDVTAAIVANGLKFKSSNEKVATVDADGKVKAVATGTATISLVKEEGQKVTTYAAFDVTVKNTTEQINTLTLKDDATVLKVKNADDLTAAFIAANVTAGNDKDGKEIFNAGMIANVEYIASNSQVIVTIADINGGKAFVFNVEVDPDLVTEPTEPTEPTDPVDTLLSTAIFTAVPVDAVLPVLATEADVQTEIKAGDELVPAVIATEADARPAINVGDVLVEEVKDPDTGEVTTPAVIATEDDVQTEIKVGDVLVPAVIATEDDARPAINVGDVLVPGTPAVNGTLVLTFTEAVSIEGLDNVDLTIDGGATVAVPVADIEKSQDGKTLTITVKPGTELAAATEIAAIAGLVDANGSAVVIADPINITTRQ
ncbi:Ig-like domain-containing protein [Brevibacillus ruminantium]|uniref:Ig-like domain-containing protein n=1 Tax=Brevibacillus ruminantium TaxID=2950604 RepID=A0ABY4WE72_9BACL|nr:Ig-like domain-containing protein [Brevibacillus ruminantium]USG65358.1 Ig-like domain-containing protein [Brevibacillus ruminantium]